MDLFVMNRQNFVLEEVNAAEIFKDISYSMKPVLAEKNVSLYINIQPVVIRVECDLFKTLMFNLMDNAIKAGCKKINICGKISAGAYAVTVSDDGSGIPASELSKITEAFYTVDKSRSRRQHGAGIGLALAAKIAEIHGGTLVFNSAEGKGTDVKFNLGVA
jgi:signal transduction histidine kinase